MNEQVEIVQGGGWSRQAAELLNRAWPKPALAYDENGIRWQMQFPGQGRMAGVWREGQLVAVGAETPRRMRLGEIEMRSRVVSFIAVDPNWRGQGLAAEIYRALLTGTRQPVLTFALSGSAGASLIEKIYPHLGWRLHRLAPCVVLGQLPKPSDETWEVGEIDPRQWQEAGDSDVLIPAPDETERIHWGLDPRRHCFVRAVNRQSGESAMAWVVVSRVLQAGGEVSEALSLESLACSRSSIGALTAITAWAARWHGQECVVRAANLSCWQKEELRRLAWRQLSTPFESWLATPEGFKAPEVVASLGAVT